MESTEAKNKQALTKKTYEVSFDLGDTHYEAKENIGSGAYGVVCKAVNKLTKEEVAIKKIPNIFEQEVIAKRTYREIKILKHFKHDNIIAIREILKPSGSTDNLRDVYIVFGLMESDLHRIIHSGQELSVDHAQYFLYQILCGLQYLHSAHVVHRDLKPSNLLVNRNCDLKIGDFGMARGIGSIPETDCKLTQYVATRYYRAPELISSKVSYTASVDMWSVGCILAELLGRKIIFMGKNPLEQLCVIIDTLGEPPKHLQKSYYDLHTKIIRGHRAGKHRSLRERLPKAPTLAMDLLENLLMYDPVLRLDVYQSLKHDFLKKYHNPERVYEQPCIPVFDFDFEKIELTKSQLKEEILKEIMDYHKPKRKSKIPFNFKPVPKSELEKTQKLKEAALKAKQAGPRTDKANAGLTTDMNQSQQAHAQSSSSLNSFFKQSDQQLYAPQTGATSGIFQNQPATRVPATDSVFKVPHGLPVAKQQLQVSTQRESTHDVEMVSAGRSGTQKGHQGQAKVVDGDVEMLSANSEVKLNISDDFKIDLTQSVSKVSECAREHKMASLKAEGEIAEEKVNTKEILKKAILEAALKKQRGEMVARPKPVTALQRQKEKEEKRRKKLERAKDKKKKKYKEQSPLLTEEDRELLQRWTNMQKSKPESTSKPQPLDKPTGVATSTAPYRTVLSPKNTNVIPTDNGVTQSMAAKGELLNTDTKSGFAVSFENTQPPVVMLQNYVVPQVQVNRDTTEHTGVTAQSTLMTSLFPNTYAGRIQQMGANSTQVGLPAQHPATHLNSSNLNLTQNLLPAATTGAFHPPPDYSEAIKANESVATRGAGSTQAAAGPGLSMQAGNEGPSPTDFLPFHSYEPGSHGDSSDVGSQLTPDLSMFDSPNTCQANVSAMQPPVYNEAAATSLSNVGVHSNADAHSNEGEIRHQGSDNAQILSIITQMKKSHMDDPLLLTLTPKTSGAPYGVGPEIGPEMFLSEDRQSAQMSASSATESLIGDWLDLIGMEGVGTKDYETLKKDLRSLEPDSI